jgi:N-acetylmuramoyl-L-alanine amidase
MIRHFPGIRARGVKTPIDGRGDAFLKLTHCPAVIAEPFFGSNAHDWATIQSRADSLVSALADGIASYHRRSQTAATK